MPEDLLPLPRVSVSCLRFAVSLPRADFLFAFCQFDFAFRIKLLCLRLFSCWLKATAKQRWRRRLSEIVGGIVIFKGNESKGAAQSSSTNLLTNWMTTNRAMWGSTRPSTDYKLYYTIRWPIKTATPKEYVRQMFKADTLWRIADHWMLLEMSAFCQVEHSMRIVVLELNKCSAWTGIRRSWMSSSGGSPCLLKNSCWSMVSIWQLIFLLEDESLRR